MGDYYRQNGVRGHPRGKNKRYRDDDDDGRYRRSHESLAHRLQKETLALAESPLSRIEDVIRNITKLYVSNYENEEVRVGFSMLLQQMIIEQPFKIPFLAAAVLAMNSSNPEAGKLILQETGIAAQKYLDEGALVKFKLALRFLACLQGMYEGDGVFDLIKALVDKAEALRNENKGLALELTNISLISLPYIMASSAIDQQEAAVAVLGRTTPLASLSHPLHGLLKPYTIDRGYIGTPTIQLLQQQLEGEAARNWDLSCLPRPWKAFREELSAATKHACPVLTIPERFDSIDESMTLPDVCFSVFSEQIVETVPPPTDIAFSIFRDTIYDTINLLDFNRIVVAKFLIDLDCYFAPDTFIKRATPFDRVKDAAGDKSTWKPEDVAVDAVFAQMLRLPNPQHKLVYYHALFTEICKIAAAAVAPSLGRAIRWLYSSLETMDVEVMNRFIDWFSHHLSNFGYTWKWTEWETNLALQKIHPKKAFIIGAIEKEIRLSFSSRIKGTLPEPYHPIISEAKEKDIPSFKYDSDDVAFSTEGKEVFNMLKERKPDAEIEAALHSVTQTAIEQGLNDPTSYTRDIYITSICYLGAKSLSHVLSCIERCKEKLLSIGQESQDARKQIVDSVMTYWKDQPGIGANVVDKLLNYSIINPSSVIEWALAAEGKSALSYNHTWEMVSITVNKVNNRVRQIVAARPSLTGPDGEDQPDEATLNMYESTLENAKIEQRHICELVLETLARIADGTAWTVEDEMMVDEEVANLEEYKGWVTWWARSWLKALGRKYRIESVISEEELRTFGL